MPLIVYTSPTNAPSSLVPPVPRYEIGTFFVSIYHVARRAKANDEPLARQLAASLVGCLGKDYPMAVNMHHPSSPASLSEGSNHEGTKDEVHDGKSDRLAHIHVELIGKQRDTGFSAEQIETLKSKLNVFDWK